MGLTMTTRNFTNFQIPAAIPAFTLQANDVLSFKVATRTTDDFHGVLKSLDNTHRLQLAFVTSNAPALRLFGDGHPLRTVQLGSDYAHGCFNDFVLTVNADATAISVSCNGVSKGNFDVSSAVQLATFEQIGVDAPDYFADVSLSRGGSDLFNFEVNESSGSVLIDSVAGNNGSFSSAPNYRASFTRDDTKALFPSGLWVGDNQGVEIPEFAPSLAGYPISSNIPFSMWLSYGQSLSVGFTDPQFQHLYAYLTSGGYKSASARYFMSQDEKCHVHSMIRQASIENSDRAFLCDTYGVPSQSIQNLSKGAGTGYYENLIAGAQAKQDSLRAGDSVSEIVIDFTQGTANRFNTAGYKEEVGQLITDLKTDIQAIVGNVPFRFIHTQQGSANSSGEEDSLEIALEHWRLESETYNGIQSQLAAPLWYILRRYPNADVDLIHSNPEGYGVKGEYKAYAYSNPSFKSLSPIEVTADISGGGAIATAVMNVETLPLQSINEPYIPQDSHKGVVIVRSGGAIEIPTSVTFEGANVIVTAPSPYQVGDKVRFGDYSNGLPYVNIFDSTGFTGEASVETLNHPAVISEMAVTQGASNQPPTANAGANQSVAAGATVTLDGTGSTDSDGTIVSYTWTQTVGDTVTLTGVNTATPSFTAPSANAQQTLTFELTVTDDGGLTATDSVDVQVAAQSLRPFFVNNSRNFNFIDSDGLWTDKLRVTETDSYTLTIDPNWISPETITSYSVTPKDGLTVVAHAREDNVIQVYLTASTVGRTNVRFDFETATRSDHVVVSLDVIS